MTPVVVASAGVTALSRCDDTPGGGAPALPADARFVWHFRDLRESVPVVA